MLSTFLTILFLLETIKSFKVDKASIIPRAKTSHIENLNWNLKRLTWNPSSKEDIRSVLRKFIESVSPIRLPESVVDKWYHELSDSGFDFNNLFDIILHSIGEDVNKSTTTNLIPKPFIESPLDKIVPLIGAEGKEELNEKYKSIADNLEPEYIFTECLVSAILHQYNKKPERKLTYDEEWELYEQGIKEGIIDQNISENYYFPSISGPEIKLRGLERYYRERVKAGANPFNEAKKILDATKGSYYIEKFKFDFKDLPGWTKDVSLAVIRHFALKTNKILFSQMLSDIAGESQVRRVCDFKDRKLLNQYVNYCMTQTKPFRGTNSHKPQHPFWFWRDVVLRISPDEDSAIKHDDPDIDVEQMTKGTLEPCCSSDNPTRDEIIDVEYQKALKSHKSKNKVDTYKTNILPSPLPPKEFLEKALPGFTPPVHFANYFKDALSQEKFDKELKKYNLEHFGSEEYEIHTGKIIKGKIISVEPKFAHVDLNAHLTGELSIEDVFKDPKTVPLGGLTKMFKEGDELYFEIIAIWPYSIRLSLVCLRELYKMKPILEHYMENKPMQFTGLYGEVFGYRAFIPRSHLSYTYHDQIKLYRPGLEGTQIPVMYLDYNYDNRVVIVSNCKSIEHEQVQFVKIGDVLKCKLFQQMQHGLLLKAIHVTCLLSVNNMSDAHFKQFKMGFSSTIDVFAQVIGFERDNSGNCYVKLSSKNGIDISIIPSKSYGHSGRDATEKRGINEFYSDWRKHQLGLIKSVPRDPPMEIVNFEEETEELKTGSFNIRSPSPSIEPLVQKIYRSDKTDYAMESLTMDLDDEEYVKSNAVLRELDEKSMVWYVETDDGLIELGPAEQKYLTTSYKQNDDITKYTIEGHEIHVDFCEKTYYHSKYGDTFKLSLKKL